MRESQSTPAIKLDNGDDLVDPNGKLGDNSLQSGAKTAQI
jgi:hypothetical protein